MLGIAELSRDALLAVPVGELVDAQDAINAEVDHGVGVPFQPVVDGGVLPSHPEDAIAAGSAEGVDLLVGSNRDEFKIFSVAILAGRTLTDDDLEGVVGRYVQGAGIADGSIAGVAINERQRLVLNRLLDGFEGKLTTSKYAKLAKCSQDTALRDILALAERGILIRGTERGRSTSYALADVSPA